MRILIAPDSFKHSMSAQHAAECIHEGIAEVLPTAQCVRLPMADGGEGTVQSLIDATGGRRLEVPAHNPLGRPITSSIGLLGDGPTAVIEMAAASGIELLAAAERDPLRASTYGTGELIRAALEQDVDTIIVGIGGSATNDGGAGMVQALGGRLLDEQGQELPRGGAALAELATIDLSALAPRAQEVTIIVACDVDNPLTGPTGASQVFGPQKGADPAMVEQLDAALANFAAVIRHDLDRDIEQVPGAGAAGGLGAGLMAVLGAEFRRGIDIVIEHTGLEQAMAETDLVITGEGAIDAQTRFGKTPWGVAQVAARHGVPVIAVAGAVGADAEVLHEHGFAAIVPVMPRPGSLEDALAEAEGNLRATAARIARLLRVGGELTGRG